MSCINLPIFPLLIASLIGFAHANPNPLRPSVPPQDEEKKCGESGMGDHKSFRWRTEVGLANYVKTSSLTVYALAPVEQNGDLTTFGSIYGRVFSDKPLQESQAMVELRQTQIGAATFHPSCLFMSSESSAEVLRKPAAGGFSEYIHQILTNDRFTLISLLPAPESGWRLRTWKRNAATLSKSGGYYVTTGYEAKTPLKDVMFKRPSDSSGDNVLLVQLKEATGVSGVRSITSESTQTVDGLGRPVEVVVKTFVGEGTSGALLSKEIITYSNRGSKAWDYTIVREQWTSSVNEAGTIGALVLTRKTYEDYDDFSSTSIGGELGMKRLMTETEAYDTAGQTPQTTIYDYVRDPSNPAIHSRLLSVTKPDGSWEYYEYNMSPNSPVAISTKYEGWKDLTVSQRANARKSVTTTSATESTEDVFVGNQLVSRSKITLATAGNEVITTSQKWDGTAWHVTTTAYHPDSADWLNRSRIKWVEYSDGTAATYAYAEVGGELVATERRGAGSRTGVSTGTEIKTTYGLGNHAIAQVTTDIESSLVTEHWFTDLTYNSGFDPMGRPIKRIYNGDAADFDITQYACCGLEETRDRMGSVTVYSRDGLKRVYKVTNQVSSGSPLVATFTTTNGLTTTRSRRVGNSDTLFLGSTTRSLDGLTTTTIEPSRKSNAETDRVTTTTVTARSTNGDIVTTTHADTSTTITAHYLDGQIKSVSGSAVPDKQYDYGTFFISEDNGGLTSTVTASGVSTVTFTDPLGRTTKTVSPATGTTAYAYHPANASAGSRGKLQSVTDGDSVTVTYGYNDEGERSTTTRTIPIVGNTTTTQTITVQNDVCGSINIHGQELGDSLRQTQTVSSDGPVESVVISESFTSLYGIISENENETQSGYITATRSLGRDTLTVTTRPDSSGVATRTTIHPDGTKTVETFTHGLTTRVEKRDTADSVISATDYGHDAHQRLETVTDSRTGTAGITTYSNFTESGQPLTTTQGTAAPNIRVTLLAKDILGRTTATTLPDESVTCTSYWPTGQVRAQWGSQTNPVFHIYDEQNRLIELHTWQTAPTLTPTTVAPPAGSAKTEWIYSPTTGLLVEKNHPGETDNGTTDPDFTYTAAGRLETRVWERGITTTYGYTHGLLTSTNYSDSTPDVAITYDSLGRQSIVTQANQSRIETTYDPATLQADQEIVSYDLDHNGNWDFTRTLDRKPTSLGRDTGWQLKNGGTIENEVTYGYHATAGRLETVANAADTFTYGYTPNSSLITTVTGPAHTVTNTWETTRDVLKTKLNEETVGTPSYPSSFGYTVNALGQRETVGPVLDENDAPVSTYSVSWGWDYNDRGELQSADHGDDATPNTHDRFYAFDAIGNRDYVRTGVYADSGGTQLDYIANDLNQYTVANGVSLPTTPTPAPHDLDGNLRFDGGVNKDNQAREYLWDAENRLIAVKRVSDSATVVSFLYDAQSRRIAKMAGTTATLYVYDSFNCIAEYSISNNQYSISRARTWGIDLSGSLQGAGGVGGLLAEKQGANNFYPTFDGNGNVSEYVAADGSVAAHFEYDPFGNTVVNTDSSDQFSYRFSTKPLDSETGLYYYQYRYLDPVTGRWPSWDPIEEQGGLNLCGFIGNDAINRLEKLGLFPYFGPGGDPAGGDPGFPYIYPSGGIPNPPPGAGRISISVQVQELNLKLAVTSINFIAAKASELNVCGGSPGDTFELVKQNVATFAVDMPLLIGDLTSEVSGKYTISEKISGGCMWKFSGILDPETRQVFDFGSNKNHDLTTNEELKVLGWLLNWNVGNFVFEIEDGTVRLNDQGSCNN